jgi:hypothetical protein
LCGSVQTPSVAVSVQGPAISSSVQWLLLSRCVWRPDMSSSVFWLGLSVLVPRPAASSSTCPSVQDSVCRPPVLRSGPMPALSGSLCRMDSSVQAGGPPLSGRPAGHPAPGPGRCCPGCRRRPPRGASSPMRAAAGSVPASASLRLPRHGQRLMPAPSVRASAGPAPPSPLNPARGVAGEPRLAGSGRQSLSQPDHSRVNRYSTSRGKPHGPAHRI